MRGASPARPDAPDPRRDRGSPEHRGAGHGRALLGEVARLAVERACGRLEWAVLNWNQPSIEFYNRLGGEPLDGWTTYRVAGEALANLARSGLS